MEAWKKVAPNLELPKTPISLMQPRPPTPATIPTKLTVNFVLPYKSEIANKEVLPSAAPAHSAISGPRSVCLGVSRVCSGGGAGRRWRGAARGAERRQGATALATSAAPCPDLVFFLLHTNFFWMYIFCFFHLINFSLSKFF